jgi:hypothetical protein
MEGEIKKNRSVGVAYTTTGRDNKEEWHAAYFSEEIKNLKTALIRDFLQQCHSEKISNLDFIKRGKNSVDTPKYHYCPRIAFYFGELVFESFSSAETDDTVLASYYAPWDCSERFYHQKYYNEERISYNESILVKQDTFDHVMSTRDSSSEKWILVAIVIFVVICICTVYKYFTSNKKPKSKVKKNRSKKRNKK